MKSRLRIRPRSSYRPGKGIHESVLAAVVLVAAFICPPDLAAQIPDSSGSAPVEGVIRIDVGGVATRDLVVLFTADSLYLPILQTATLLGLEIRPDSDGSTSLSVDERPLFIFDSLGSRQYTDSGAMAPASGYRHHFGTSYIEWQRILDLLDIRGVFDIDHLFLRLVADDNIPVVAWSRRSRIESIEGLTARTDQGYSEAEFHRYLIGSPELYWRLSHNAYRSHGRAFTNDATGILGLSGPLLFGQLDLGIATRYTPQGVRDFDWDLTHWRWTYSRPNASLLTSLRIGSDVAADRPVTGLSLTNRALLPRRLLAVTTYRGTAVPGTEVELVRGRSGVVRTVADSTGHYSIEVPVGYGTTTAIIRSGETGRREFERLVSWNPADRLLPVGTLEYHIGAGITRDGRDDVIGDLSIRGGISTRWTIEGYATGIIESEGSDRTLRNPEASIGVIGWLGQSSAIRGAFDVRTMAFRGGLFLGSPIAPGLSIVVDSITVDGSSELSAAARLPIGPVRIDGGSRLYRDRDGNFDVSPFGSVRAGLGNTSVALSAATPRINATRNVRDLAISFDLFAFARSWLPVGAGIRWHRDSLIVSEYYVQASAHLTGGAIAGLLATVPFDSPDDARYALRIEVPIGGIRPVLRATTGNGMTILSTTVEGTTLASTHGVRMLPVGMRGQTSFLLTGFEDRNANGRRDPGEPSLGRLSGDLHSEGTTIAFEDGRIDAFAPFRYVTVEVDRFSQASLGLVPLRSRYEITTGPSARIHIDVPFAPGGELYGRIVIEEDGVLRTSPLLSALTAWLMSESGARFEGEVFSDGTLYFAGVPQGRYHLSFDSRQLRARGLCPPEGTAEIVVETDTREIPEAVLTRCHSR